MARIGASTLNSGQNTGEIVYALSSYTIKEDHGKFFIAKTALWGGSHHWSKGYGSLTQATNAIARHIQKEWSERKARNDKQHRRLKRKAA